MSCCQPPRHLKKGRILGFLADQDAGPGGAFIEFLGKTASTPMGAAVFAKKFNSPIIPAFILRQPDGHHKVLVGDILRYEDTGDADKDLFNLTYKMTKILRKGYSGQSNSVAMVPKTVEHSSGAAGA